MDRAREALMARLSDNHNRVLCFLSLHDHAEVDKLVSETQITRNDVERAIDFLIRYEPPLINKSGRHESYQLSPVGKKLMKVTTPVAPIKKESYEIAPGPRGQLVIALKSRPHSVKELAEITGLAETQVRYFIKTLEDRALIAKANSLTDGRTLVYRLKWMQYEEPAKPLLTPSLVPLDDPTDWHTWAERLLVEEMAPDSPPSAPTIETPQPKETAVLPKVLVVGYFSGSQVSELENHFSNRIKLYFFDRNQQSGGLLDLCKRMDHIFLRVDHCSHKDSDSVKSSRASFDFIHGNLSRMQQAIDAYCAKASARNNVQRLFK